MVEEKSKGRKQTIGFVGEGDAGSGRSLGGDVVGWLKVQVRRESDVGALSRPMLQLESLAGLFFCSMRYSNLGSGISCLLFGAAPHGCPVAQVSQSYAPAAELETGGVCGRE